MIFFKRHVFQDSWGSADTGGSDTVETPTPPKTMGDPNEGPQQPTMGDPNEGPQQPSSGGDYLQQLHDMYSGAKTLDSSLKSLSQLYAGYTPGSSFNVQTPGQVESAREAAGQEESPGLLRRLGIYRGFSFDNETPSQQADRMGLVGNAIGTVGNAAISTMMPPPLSAALGAIKGYEVYKDTGDVKKGLGTALSGLPGYFGAAGNALQGNYGSALTGALTKSGVAAPEAALAGMGLDYSMGKDVTKPAAGLGGYFVGRSLGGPVGGVFGQNIGKSLANIYGKK